ncbi:MULTISPECIES: BMP family protein [unclassified Meiothermus]|uniref:BMP family lipoprotein n=1 Tax=unclassified Meiothermus TaxID=370471 RepID=UPI000D7BA4E3|nr:MULTISPECIES: BMP family ABC transporter substrate-binding protein [unclassified Meiothermus]PZA08085.1 BMP family ABC transporter substrate-binding protein [Meiothermus sp. Pnk-1]RYM38789.1 BMP family ABC transporter substrate-binding protein [Meiothermus sp. PNK-Is4]
MKKPFALGLALSAALGLALAQNTVRVGIAFDAGGKNDRSFNQSAWEGAQRAQKDFKIGLFDFEPADPSQVGQGIRRFAEEGFNLVIGVGFANNPAITENAKNFKDVNFAVIDDVPGEGKLPNAVGLVFREQEGSFLVGYIAGKLSQTGVVGFIGGMDIPLIHKFEVGYKAGAEYAFKEDGVQGKVLVGYVGNTPAAWNDPAKAKEIATSQVGQGADIIYSAAGASGLGSIDYIKQKKCIKASELPSGVKFIRNPFANVPRYAAYNQNCTANDRPLFFIGVDANQNYLGDTDNNPATLNHGLTSMLKRVDVATYEVIKSVVQKNFKGGVREFGLNNNGVGYAFDQYNRALIPAGVITKLDAIRKDIVAGKIKVPSER